MSRLISQRALFVLISVALLQACEGEFALSGEATSGFSSSKDAGDGGKVDDLRGDSTEHTRESDGELTAPEWLLSLNDTGLWVDDERRGVLRAWMDARVANTRYDKRIFIEVKSIYRDQREIRLLAPAHYRGKLGSDERWGSDDIELYPSEEGGENDLERVTV